MDVKTIRNKLVSFIKEQLQKWEGGEGTKLKGLQLFLSPGPEDKDLYEAALFKEEDDRFKEEVQKIADDFAIDLPFDWSMNILFVESLPLEGVHSKELPVALNVVTGKQPMINKPSRARITVLTGEAEQNSYLITAQSGKIFIGRDHQVQTSDGFYRINNIAFPGDSKEEGNKYISRQHAHIEWQPEAGCFFLFADEGGVPPRNKVKVQTNGGQLIRLQTIQIGHPLEDRDQIALGDKALLLFEYEK